MTTSVPQLRGNSWLNTARAMFGDRLRMVAQLGEQIDSIAALKLGPRLFVMVTEPELIQQVLVDKAAAFHKGRGLSTFGRPLLGNGLLTSEDDFWRQQRRLVAPAFAHRRVAAYADTMAQYSEQTQASWRDGAVIDVAREMMHLTLGIVGKTLFDADVISEADDLGAALATAMRYIVDRVRQPFTLPYFSTKREHEFIAALARLDQTVYGMIEQRRQSGVDNGDLLSMLLLAEDEGGSQMTAKQVRDEAMTLFLAGHETTANATAWAWYLLTQHPATYTKLQAELDAVLQGRTPTYADLPNLPYTAQVFKEAMRLYPPAPSIGRMAMQDVRIGNYQLAAGTTVLVSPYVMHHKATYFPAPKRFQPERWTAEMEKGLPRYAYMPFGGGPRICIGNQFALMEGQLIIATLAQRIRFALEPHQQVQAEALVTLRPKQGIKVRVLRRP